MLASPKNHCSACGVGHHEMETSKFDMLSEERSSAPLPAWRVFQRKARVMHLSEEMPRAGVGRVHMPGQV